MGYGSENLVILQKLEDAIEYAYCVFRKFPKSERFTLVADLKNRLYRMLELVVVANKSKNKIPFLNDIDIELDVFRSLVRVSFRMKYLAPKQYEIISVRFNEFGRLLGGWMRQNRNH